MPNRAEGGPVGREKSIRLAPPRASHRRGPGRGPGRGTPDARGYGLGRGAGGRGRRPWHRPGGRRRPGGPHPAGAPGGGPARRRLPQRPSARRAAGHRAGNGRRPRAARPREARPALPLAGRRRDERARPAGRARPLTPIGAGAGEPPPPGPPSAAGQTGAGPIPARNGRYAMDKFCLSRASACSSPGRVGLARIRFRPALRTLPPTGSHWESRGRRGRMAGRRRRWAVRTLGRQLVPGGRAGAVGPGLSAPGGVGGAGSARAESARRTRMSTAFYVRVSGQRRCRARPSSSSLRACGPTARRRAGRGTSTASSGRRLQWRHLGAGQAWTGCATRSRWRPSTGWSRRPRPAGAQVRPPGAARRGVEQRGCGWSSWTSPGARAPTTSWCSRSGAQWPSTSACLIAERCAGAGSTATGRDLLRGRTRLRLRARQDRPRPEGVRVDGGGGGCLGRALSPLLAQDQRVAGWPRSRPAAGSALAAEEAALDGGAGSAPAAQQGLHRPRLRRAEARAPGRDPALAARRKSASAGSRAGPPSRRSGSSWGTSRRW